LSYKTVVFDNHQDDPQIICGARNPLCDENRSTVLEGALEIRSGELSKTWKRRFFVLDASGVLTYYRSEMDRLFPDRAKGMILISRDARIKQGRSKDGRPHIKILDHDSSRTWRTVKVSALSEESHREWMEGLERVQNTVCYVSVLHRGFWSIAKVVG
jgi:hypothetical protein